MRNLRIAVLLLLVLGGCEKRREAKDEWNPFKAEAPDAILILDIEQTERFRELIQGSNPNAFKFIMQVIDRFEAAYPASNAQVILGEICERTPEESILWQGSVAELRAHFKTAWDFNYSLKNRQSPTGRVYENIHTMLKYAMRLPGVREGKTKVAAMFLSSMNDKSQNPEEARRKLVEALRESRQMHFAIGFFWVDLAQTDKVDKILAEAGCPSVAWSRFVEMPAMPNFED